MLRYFLQHKTPEPQRCCFGGVAPRQIHFPRNDMTVCCVFVCVCVCVFLCGAVLIFFCMCFYVRAFVLFCLRVFVSAFSCLCFCVFMFCVKAHRKETQRENTDRKHRERTQRRNTERKHTQKTQTVQTFLWWCFCGVWLSF